MKKRKKKTIKATVEINITTRTSSERSKGGKG